MPINVQAVTSVIEEAARTLILQRFSRLSADEVEAKATPGDPEDLVTIVDREVETHLSKVLAELTPSAAVIGEEAAHHRPELLQLLASDEPLWVIDPIDGTKNFAAGDSGFGIMVAYVVDCAAIEYTDILRGLSDFVVYYRLLPWDHAAPALILTEAGGRVSHFTGQPYTARSESQLTIVARDVGIADQLCAWLRPHVPRGS